MPTAIQEWTDVDNLRRFSKLSRRMRIRSVAGSQVQSAFERHAVQRHSMPEIQRADLVYLRSYQEEQQMRMIAEYYRSEERLSDWKPRTDFERSYFGDCVTDNRPSSSMNYYECSDQHLLKDLGHQKLGKLDQNSNLIRSKLEAELVTKIPRRIDDYVVPHSPEFSTSRDRLHEIFEHNRYLRRKFFADMPDGNNQSSSNQKSKQNNNNNNNINKNNNNNKNNSNYPRKLQSMANRFGSTETLTSQSNQSAGSSTDGRKSRAEFGNTPDSVDFELKSKPSKLVLPLTYFGSDRHGGTWRSVTNRLEERPRLPSITVWDDISRRGSGKSDLNSISKLLERTKGDEESKYFASYVRVTDSSDSSDSPEGTRCDQEDIDLSRYSILKNSCSLLDLHRRGETRVERMIRQRGGQIVFNKSCTDLASLEEDDLLSPRLVGHALSASRERGLEEQTRIQQQQQQQHENATGTTLPSVYGPIPYS